MHPITSEINEALLFRTCLPLLRLTVVFNFLSHVVTTEESPMQSRTIYTGTRLRKKGNGVLDKKLMNMLIL